MKAAIIHKPGDSFSVENYPIPEPGPGEVRVKVSVCGLCRGDVYTVDGSMSWITYPRIPGHEVAGIVDKVGENVSDWQQGDRIGVGWFGGACGNCTCCQSGEVNGCENKKISGKHFDGGLAEYMVTPVDALARIPEGLSDKDAASIMCAGLSTFNALRNSVAEPGDLVAIQGIGGLGHMAIQYAHHMGFKTVAIGQRQEKAALACELGANEYIDATETNAADTLIKMGGAKVVLATAPNKEAIEGMVESLRFGGQLVLLAGVHDKISVSPMSLIVKRRSIQGWPSGTPKDAEEAMDFSVKHGIRPMTEAFALNQINEAYSRMISGEAQFRVILDI